MNKSRFNTHKSKLPERDLFMNKKGFEISFAWLFGIIVGAAIIFLAIYSTTSLIRGARYESDTKIAAQVQTILNPLETNLEEGKFARVSFPDETRVYNECLSFGTFGSQKIRTSTRSGIGVEWQEPGVGIESSDKYIFSDRIVQGQEAYFFIKKFEMPWKVSDLTVMYSQDYCFVNPTADVEQEIESLNLLGVEIVSSLNECAESSKTVCFSGEECDITVSSGEVKHQSKSVSYEDNLIYAAIFSSPEVYECQLKRLMKRNSELAGLYEAKAGFLEGRGCSTGLSTELKSFSEFLKNFDSSKDLGSVKVRAGFLEDKNELLNCKLF